MVLSHCLNDQSDTPRSRDTSVMERPLLNQSHCVLFKLPVIPPGEFAAVGLHRDSSFLFRKAPDRKIEETSVSAGEEPLTSILSNAPSGREPEGEAETQPVTLSRCAFIYAAQGL